MAPPIDAVAAIPSSAVGPPPPASAGPADRSTPAPRSDVPQSGSPPSAQAVQAALDAIREHVAGAGNVLEFSVDRASGLTVVTVKDSSTGEVIRQIPDEEIVRLAEVLSAREDASGALIDSIA